MRVWKAQLCKHIRDIKTGPVPEIICAIVGNDKRKLNVQDCVMCPAFQIDDFHKAEIEIFDKEEQ